MTSILQNAAVKPLSTRLIIAMVLGWTSILMLSSSYCYTHSLVTNEGQPDFLFSIVWALKITVFWLFAIPLSFIHCNKIYALPSLKQKIRKLVLFGLALVITAFIFQIILWWPVTWRELPFLAYLFLPKALIAYICLSLIWYLLYVKKRNNQINLPETKTKIYPEKIIAAKGNSEVLVSIEEVSYIKSAGNYIELYINCDSFLLRSSMKSILQKLDPSIFIRVHRQYIINISHIKKLQALGSDQPILILRDTTSIPVGRQYRSALTQYKK